METNKIKANVKQTFHLSGDASGGKAVAWQDMRDFGAFLVGVVAAALTGVGVTAFKIVGSASSDGSNPVDIKSHALGSAPDAAGDALFLEVQASEVQAAGSGIRYVSAYITTANAADNIVASYLFTKPRFAHDGLTADSVA